jgi:hypothetical protein
MSVLTEIEDVSTRPYRSRKLLVLMTIPISLRMKS